MGVSVENRRFVSRIDMLRQTHARTKFLSLEPLLGPLPSLNLEGIDWVIVGGESGPGSRPIQRDWVIDIRDQCVAATVPFFFNNGAECRRNVQGVFSKIVRGMRCQPNCDSGVKSHRVTCMHRQPNSEPANSSGHLTFLHRL